MTFAHRHTRCAARLLAVWLLAGAAHAGVSESLAALQRDHDVLRYQAPPAERLKGLQGLATRAHQLTARHAERGDTLVWEAIVLHALAEAQGGWAGLRLAGQARSLFEAALSLENPALAGVACDQLGALYHRVPGWPISFGDDARARALIDRALALDPAGLDPNLHCGQLLLDLGQVADALPCLERAVRAPDRPGRRVADTAQRQEAQRLLLLARSRLPH